jgi:hypothetical protein
LRTQAQDSSNRSVSKAAVPVRVLHVLDLAQENPPILAILVTRDR